MKFANINMLYFIWAVPLLIGCFIYGTQKRTRILQRYAGRYNLKSISPGYAPKKRRISALFMVLSILCLAIAMAGPRYGFKWEKIERKGVDIFVAIDCSKSMMAEDISPTRLTRAKYEMFDLLNMLEGDRAGLIAFAGTAFIQCPLTLDYQAFNIFMNALSPDYMPVGGTNIAGAINTAITGFNTQNANEKALIIITDGENTGEDLDNALDKAVENNIRIYCVGVGKKEGIPVPDGQGGFKKDKNGKVILTKMDDGALKTIAKKTGGTYVRSVAGDMDLEKIYMNQIRKKMDRQSLTTTRKKVWEDRYQWLLSLSVLFLAVSMAIVGGKTKKTGWISAVFLAFCFLFVSVPANADSVYKNTKEGIEAYDQQEFSEASDHFTKAQLEDPENPVIFYNLAGANYKSGDFEAALNNYQKVLNTEDNNLKQKALYNIGNTYFRIKQYEEAVSAYDKALKLDPDDAKAEANRAFVKKLMEKQQKQEQQKNKDQKNNPQKDEKKDKNDPQQKNSGNENKQKPDQQQEKKDKSNSQKPDQQQKNQAPDAQKQPGSQSKKQQASKEPKQNSNTEKMLNRLEDKPGRAMIPAYDNRNVEKDW